jgi:hypothetical protein
MSKPLMPKATAVWLVENTGLTFDQIAEFCGLHYLEVQAIADDEVAVGMVGMDPVANGQLTKEEIARCEADPAERLKLHRPDIPMPQLRSKGPRYTPVTKRAEKPDAVAWLVKTYPELSDAAIARLIGTTKPTINSIRDRSHWNTPNIKPRSPVLLGICKQADLDAELEKAARRRPAEAAAAEQQRAAEAERAEEERRRAAAEADPFGGFGSSSGSGLSDQPDYDPFAKMGRSGEDD